MHRIKFMLAATTLAGTLALGGGAALIQDECICPEPDCQVCTGQDYDATTNPFSELSFMLGEWDVAIKFESPDGQVQELTSVAKVTEILDGKAISETHEITYGEQTFQMQVLFSWDAAREVFRVARIESGSGRLDVFEGDFVDGKLTLDNIRCGTGHEGPDGTTMNSQVTVNPPSPDGFTAVWAMSSDGGKEWQSLGTMKYTRRVTP